MPWCISIYYTDIVSMPSVWRTCAMIHLSCRQLWCQVFTPACNQLSSLTLSLHDPVSTLVYGTVHQTHTHAQTQMHADTHRHKHTLIEPTWVVKLVACISGIDLFGIEPCHCCHLNFRPGTSPNRSPPPPSTTNNFPVPSLSEWKMDGTLDHRLFHSFMDMLLSPNQLRANFLWLPVKMSVERKSFISLLQMLTPHFIKLSPVKYIPPTQAKAPRGQKPVKPLIEIAILSEKISPWHRFTNRVVISLGQVRWLLYQPP